MRMLIGLAAMLLAFVLAPAAGATTGPAMFGMNGTPGMVSNTGAVSGNASTYAAHTFAIGVFTISMVDANFDTLSTTTTTATIKPTYAGCSLLVSNVPVAAANCETSCDWTLSVTNGTFNSTTAATTGGTLTLGCPFTFTIPAVGCSLHVYPQTRPGVSLQNMAASGANDTSATPWGSKLIWNLTGLTYTSVGSCPGVTEHGTASYIGTLAVRNLFATL